MLPIEDGFLLKVCGMDLPVAEICQEHDCQHCQQLAVELLGRNKVSTCCPKKQAWKFMYLLFGW